MEYTDSRIDPAKNRMRPYAVSRTGFIAALRGLAVDGLRRMYRPQERRFVWCLRKVRDQVRPEGRSPRYTAITLIGLAGEDERVRSDVFGGHTAEMVLSDLAREMARAGTIGDTALTLWAARALGRPDGEGLRQRLRALVQAPIPAPTVEIAWALDALCDPADTGLGVLRDQLADALLRSCNPDSGLFPHVIAQRDQSARSHVCCFADIVYPIHALANYARLTGNRAALRAAARCAVAACERQGRDGQWWWHYDVRTGAVVERYPVYSVHQEAMAPMALFALRDAGGPDLSLHIHRGLEWMRHAPEIGASLVDKDAGVIWRKVGRREPGKLSRYLQAAVTRWRPGLQAPALDTLFPPVAVDYETRPYHLGWLLYAWPVHRAEAWDGAEQL